jgi:tRNA pseudouridine65 synthase
VRLLLKTKGFIAVEKPAGISVHNSERGENLLEVLARQLQLRKLFPVHRLDQETSGVQILALDAASARELSHIFQTGAVEKTYVGLLRGKLKEESGTWDGPLSDKAEGRRNPRGILSHRVPCQTGFRVLQRSAYFTYCEFDLLTGRQHQIRKHAALSGHSIVGDSRYGDSKYNQKVVKIYQVDRMFLHCTRLCFDSFRIESPAPSEFSKLLG